MATVSVVQVGSGHWLIPRGLNKNAFWSKVWITSRPSITIAELMTACRASSSKLVAFQFPKHSSSWSLWDLTTTEWLVFSRKCTERGIDNFRDFFFWHHWNFQKNVKNTHVFFFYPAKPFTLSPHNQCLRVSFRYHAPLPLALHCVFPKNKESLLCDHSTVVRSRTSYPVLDNCIVSKSIFKFFQLPPIMSLIILFPGPRFTSYLLLNLKWTNF